MSLKAIALAGVAAVLTATSASAMVTSATERAELANVAVTQGFAAFVEEGDLLKTIGVPAWQENVTYFAPTASALRDFGAENIADLLKPENEVELARFIGAHVALGALPTAQITGHFDRDDSRPNAAFRSATGGLIKIEDAGFDLEVNGHEVVSANMRVGGALVHQIDGVIGG